MKNIDTEIQGVKVTIFRMPVEPALEMWDKMFEAFSDVLKDFKYQSDGEENPKMIEPQLLIGSVGSNILRAISGGVLSDVSKKSIRYIHIDGKNVDTIEKMAEILYDRDIDPLAFLDDLLIQFLKFQFGRKVESLKKKVGLDGSLDLRSIMSSMGATGDSGQSSETAK